MAWATGSCPWRAAIVGEGTPDGAAVAPDDLGLGIGASRRGPFQGAPATAVCFADRLRLAVRLVEGVRGFLEGMAGAEGVRPRGYSLGHGTAQGAWPSGAHPHPRHCQRRLDLTATHG